jgi:membrane complex biogenesis BtpA family protein
MLAPRPFGLDRPALIGMVHLLPLPGAPASTGQVDVLLDAAAADAQALVAGGCDAVMVENFGDVPFFKTNVPPLTVAAMTRAVMRIRQEVGDLPVGVNVLRNDGRSALAIAVATGASFIRVNVLSGARVADQGVIEGEAAQLLRDRHAARAERVTIWADVDVKHSAPLAKRPIREEVQDLVRRGRADAIIVTGGGTGLPTSPDAVHEVRQASDHLVPLLVGSGITAESIGPFLPHCDGVIVGTALKLSGRVDQPVDPDRVRRLADAVRAG